MLKNTCSKVRSQLVRFHDASLPEPEMPGLHQHLEFCSDCREFADFQGLLILGFEALAEKESVEPHPTTSEIVDFVVSGSKAPSCVSGHLLHCADCRQEVLALQAVHDQGLPG